MTILLSISCGRTVENFLSPVRHAAQPGKTCFSGISQRTDSNFNLFHAIRLNHQQQQQQAPQTLTTTRMQESLYPVVTGVDHVRLFVGNSLLASDFYCTKFGFVPHAMDGFQTGNKHLCTRVIKQKNVYFALTSALQFRKTLLTQQEGEASSSSSSSVLCAQNERTRNELCTFHEKYELHGENHVRDVAFSVQDVQQAFDRAVAHGARIIQSPQKFPVQRSNSSKTTVPDEAGTEESYIEMAVIQPPFAGWVHTLIKRVNCSIEDDVFLPGYRSIPSSSTAADANSASDHGFFEYIDHMACAILKDSLRSVVQWYSDALQFSRYISSDDDKSDTGLSIESSDVKDTVGLRTMTMTPNTHNDRSFKIVFVEPVNTEKTKSQIQEFLDFHGDTGIAHLALYTDRIVDCVRFARQHSVPFISVPSTYYSQWKNNRRILYDLVQESWTELEEQSILCDGVSARDNEFSYLLQTFTEPLQDRPTFYLEVISRRGANGFGKGNIKSLFDAIEQLQKERGNFEI